MYCNAGCLAGLVGTALALALEWAASRVIAGVIFAPLALADRLIRLAPGEAAALAIETLGPASSQALAVGVTLAFVVMGTKLPAWTARPFVAGGVFALGLFCAGIVAPVRPSVAPAAGIAAAAGLLYATAVQWVLREPAPTVDGGSVDRRRALVWAASSAVGLVLGGTLIGRLLGDRSDASIAITQPRTPPAEPPRNGFPRVPGLSAEVTPVTDHYVVDINIVNPDIEADEWQLRVAGLVDSPATLTFTELQGRFEVVEQVSVLTCVSNEVGGSLVGNSAWTGVRLRDVLRAAGVHRSAADVVFRCADGYDVSVPVARAMQPTALLAIGQNGRALTRDHGFPCRVRVPALYGMMNAKWVESITVIGSDHLGYWAKRGWSPIAEVRTQSRIETPQQAHVGEPTWIAGVAWAGDREISRVEVSIDAGQAWNSAVLAIPSSPVAWTQWAYRWTPDRAGTARVLCRASDGTGHRQARRKRRSQPSGATGYHEIDVPVSN